MSEPLLPPNQDNDASRSQPSFPFVDRQVPPMWEPDSVVQPISAPPPPPDSILGNPSQPYDWAVRDESRPTLPFIGTTFGMGMGIGCGALAMLVVLVGLLVVAINGGAFRFLGINGHGVNNQTSISYTAAQATATQAAKDSNGGSGSGVGTNDGSSSTPQPGVAGANATATPTLFPGETPTVPPTLAPGVTPTGTSAIPTNTPQPVSTATATSLPPTATPQSKLPLSIVNPSPSDHKISFTVMTLANTAITITTTCGGSNENTIFDTVGSSGTYDTGDIRLKVCKGASSVISMVTGHQNGYLDNTASYVFSDANKGYR